MYDNLIDEFINKVSSLNVAIIGETIVDEFITVSYEGSIHEICLPSLKIRYR